MTKKNGFFYFMLEFRSRQEAAGHKVVKLDQIVERAGKVWEKMDAKQRAPYIQKAKSTPSEGGLDKFNSLGFGISEIDKELRSKKDYTKDIKVLVSDLVKNAESRHALEKEVVYIISLAYFGCTISGKYIPAELGMVKYSLQDGVMDRLHFYINPGELPLGAALSVQNHTEKTHKLPLPPNAWGISDKDEVAVRLFSFMEVEDEIPPLFTDEETLPMVQGMLRQLLSDHIEDKMLYVCPLPELFCCLKQATERRVMARPTFPSALTAQHILKMDSFAFAAGISCEYHETDLNPQNCALSQATRWAYTLSKYCCLHMNIQCVPGKHVPRDHSAHGGDYEYPTTSGTNKLAKEEQSHDSYGAAAKPANPGPVAKSSTTKETCSESVDKSSKVPHKPSVSAAQAADVNNDEEQNEENLFPTLLQSMEPTVKTRGYSRGRGRGRGRGHGFIF